MSLGFATIHDTTDDHHAVEKRGLVGEWEIDSWGDGRFPGMAAVSAIATLQLGATLTEVSADKIAMSKAAEYLIRELAPQLKAFQQALATG